MDSRWSPPNPPGLPGVHLEYVEQGKVLLPTPHIWRLGPLVVYVGPEVLGERFGGSLGLFDGGVDFSFGCFVEGLWGEGLVSDGGRGWERRKARGIYKTRPHSR